MRKIKTFLFLLCCFIILTGFTSNNSFPDNDNTLDKNILLYEVELDMVVELLKAQKMLDHLPIYKAHLEGKYFGNTSTSSTGYVINKTSYNAYLPNGGYIYYSNYLGYGLEVSQVYLNQSDTNKYMNGSFTSSLMMEIIGSFPFVGTIVSFLNLYNDIVFREIKNGSGRMYIMKSYSLDSESTGVLHR